MALKSAGWRTSGLRLGPVIKKNARNGHAGATPGNRKRSQYLAKRFHATKTQCGRSI
jgi:hypothetical protein